MPHALSIRYILVSVGMFYISGAVESGESIVLIHHLVYITLCRWPSGVSVREGLSDLHTRRPPTQSDIYQMMY